jgi:hypothetical protein
MHPRPSYLEHDSEKCSTCWTEDACPGLSEAEADQVMVSVLTGETSFPGVSNVIELPRRPRF